MTRYARLDPPPPVVGLGTHVEHVVPRVDTDVPDIGGEGDARRSDTRLGDLTAEQIVASGTMKRRVFIEAEPGSGKTTVAAQRYGAQRFFPADRRDTRSVVAVSFTRAATWELHRRVRRTWGPSAVQWPHRIVTLDTIMCDLLTDLLATGLVRWPNGHLNLRVEDSWKVLTEFSWRREVATTRLDGSQVVVETGYAKSSASRVPPEEYRELVEAGTCTHEEIRAVLESALERDDVVERLVARFGATTRALIVDEVFDANDLDIAIIELAIRAGVDVSLVGDPWQALYVFRGARPDSVKELIARADMTTLPLTASFRWRTDAQRNLVEKLRRGIGVTLDRESDGGRAAGVDVVLGIFWKDIWEVGAHVLPLAFHSPKGGAEEAAATLLLNHVTCSVLGEEATYLGDALITLGITDKDAPRRLGEKLQGVLEQLAVPGKEALKAAYEALAAAVKTESPRTLRRAHPAHTKRLDDIRIRMAHTDRPVPGLTTHQAKGREWDVVGMRLSQTEREALQGGLNVTEDTHRKLYVACTRARYCTVEV